MKIRNIKLKNIVKMSEEECLILCCKFNKTTRKKVQCPKCNTLVCSKCYTDYYNQNQLEPICVNCNLKFSKTFISENFTKKFINTDLKEIIMNQILVKDLQDMPKYMELAKYDKQIYEENIKIDKDLLHNCQSKSADDNLFYRQLSTCDDVLLNKALMIKTELDYWQKNYVMASSYEKKEKKEKNQFIKKCSKNNCNGFLSTRWKCELCDTKFCSKCLEEEDENHECNPDNVATANEIRKNSKNCPNPVCGVPIYRIYGCSHMFCVNCKTCFDWNTMAIQKKNTNPHFYEYLNNHNNLRRDINDIPCGGFDILTFTNIIRDISKSITSNNTKEVVNNYVNFHSSFISSICSFYIHNSDVTVSRLGSINTKMESYNDENNKRFTKLRIDYLNSNITDKIYKSKMYTYQKKKEYLNDMYDIIESFNQSFMFHMQNFTEDLTNFMTNKKTSNSKKYKFIHNKSEEKIPGELLVEIFQDVDSTFAQDICKKYFDLNWKANRDYENISEVLLQNACEIIALMKYYNNVLENETKYYNYTSAYKIKVNIEGNSSMVHQRVTFNL